MTMWGSGEEGASITPGGSVCKRALRLLEFMLYTSLSAAQNGSDLGVILERTRPHRARSRRYFLRRRNNSCARTQTDQAQRQHQAPPGVAASSPRTAGATRVPRISMARIIF